MNSKEIDAQLNETDELLHQPTEELKWRESYYFNWVDIQNEVSGFSTIGIVPNEKRREFVFLLFLKDRNEVYYKEPSLLHYENNIETMLTEKKLTFKLIEPFKKWEIEYKSRKLKFNIIFDTRFPTFFFGVDSSASWHQHFESSGVVTGNLQLFDGTAIKISGYGQRDKSWGYRDWHQFDKWYAGHFQFKDWSCTFRKDYCESRIDISGHTSTKQGNSPISEIEIKTVNDNDQFKSPLSATYIITDMGGHTFTIKSKRIKKDSFIRFVRNFQGGYTELFEQMVIMKNIDTGEIGSGMMVSFIQSNYLGFGSGIVIPGTGISLQNRGNLFSLKQGHPNQVGPNKRPFHTIIPAFVSNKKNPIMSFGVMGGAMQPQGHAQLMTKIFEYGQNPQAAVDAPRWRVIENLKIILEHGFNIETSQKLRKLGHQISYERFTRFGGAQLIYKLDNGYLGASDPRKDGQAVGF